MGMSQVRLHVGKGTLGPHGRPVYFDRTLECSNARSSPHPTFLGTLWSNIAWWAPKIWNSSLVVAACKNQDPFHHQPPCQSQESLVARTSVEAEIQFAMRRTPQQRTWSMSCTEASKWSQLRVGWGYILIHVCNLPFKFGWQFNWNIYSICLHVQKIEMWKVALC